MLFIMLTKLLTEINLHIYIITQFKGKSIFIYNYFKQISVIMNIM